jgi:glycosyltransferase involved in cell wall biosynthesis
VAVNARVGGGADAGVHGGIEQVVIGLAKGLSSLTDGDEQYYFLVGAEEEGWIEPYLGGPCRVLRHRERPRDPRLVHRLQRNLRWWAPVVRRYWWKARWPPPVEGREQGLAPRSDGQPLLTSDGILELADIDVVHFPFQTAFLTKLPSIYQPHDLQHLHFPELFSEGERESRELRYRTYSEDAALAVMMNSWGKRDLVERYGLPESKVAVVNWGSILDAYPSVSESDLAEVRSRLSLGDDFILYPAQAWPHKNHANLLEALALIRARDGVTIPLVCPGRENEFFPQLQRRVEALDLQEAVTFPGFVSPLEIRSLYSLATALVFPSKFEGWGMPISEAFASGLPVASSSATGLGDMVGDAGLIFDPDDPEGIADAVFRLWNDAELRRSLEERGRRRAEAFSIDSAVRLFRAHYRRIGGRRLSEEDRDLLEGPPLA